VGGGKPYCAQGLQQWIENAPGFATDKISAPVLVLPATPQDLISLWPLYASLKDQGRAVDLQHIRNGQHTSESRWRYLRIRKSSSIGSIFGSMARKIPALLRRNNIYDGGSYVRCAALQRRQRRSDAMT
jgi:hypothetical protein